MSQCIEFAIVVPSYNNAFEHTYVKNLSSIITQSYPHFHLYYIDDASTDSTAKLVAEFIESSGFKERATLISNKVRKGSLANQYEIIHQIEPHKVIVCLDGDDTFAHSHVLDVVARAYSDPNIWLTYGSFETDPPGRLAKYRCHAIPKATAEALKFRQEVYLLPALKTFYAKLFQRVAKADLLWNDSFFPMAGDISYFLCMLEMASQGHYRFIEEVLYIYNLNNPISDAKINSKLQQKLAFFIRNSKPYKPLNDL